MSRLSGTSLSTSMVVTLFRTPFSTALDLQVRYRPGTSRFGHAYAGEAFVEGSAILCLANSAQFQP